MTRKIIQCNNKEVTVGGDGIEYTYRFIDNPSFSFDRASPKSGFEIKIINDAIKDNIHINLDVFIINDTRSENLGRIFSKNLDCGLISWENYKWLNSHCYTNKTKTWLTNGRLLYDIEDMLFGFHLNKKLQGQCNYKPVIYTNHEVFDLVLEETHKKFSHCPICNK
jgi:hypothetical protein